MATEAQQRAARRNVKKAASAAPRKKTIAKMPTRTRSPLGRQGAAVARRRQRKGGDETKTRQELYEEAKRRDLPGRPKMGRAELARALGER